MVRTATFLLEKRGFLLGFFKFIYFFYEEDEKEIAGEKRKEEEHRYSSTWRQHSRLNPLRSSSSSLSHLHCVRR